jgi:hypothetical protein
MPAPGWLTKEIVPPRVSTRSLRANQSGPAARVGTADAVIRDFELERAATPPPAHHRLPRPLQSRSRAGRRVTGATSTCTRPALFRCFGNQCVRWSPVPSPLPNGRA